MVFRIPTTLTDPVLIPDHSTRIPTSSARPQGTPNDWPEYQRRVFQVPEVIELQQRLEQLLGPVERCIYWSV